MDERTHPQWTHSTSTPTRRAQKKTISRSIDFKLRTLRMRNWLDLHRKSSTSSLLSLDGWGQKNSSLAAAHVCQKWKIPWLSSASERRRRRVGEGKKKGVQSNFDSICNKSFSFLVDDVWEVVDVRASSLLLLTQLHSRVCFFSLCLVVLFHSQAHRRRPSVWKVRLVGCV